MLQPETGFKPRDRKARERRVLDAARAVFSESSFEAARVEEVARRAGVSKGTVYNVVGSKEELFLRCLADSMEEARQRIEKLIGDEQAPRAALRALVRTLFLDLLPTLIGDRTLRHQAVGALASSSPLRDRLVGQLRRFYREREQDFARLVNTGGEAGIFRSDVSPEDVAVLLQATLDGLVYRASLDPGRVEPERLAAAFLSLLAGGLESGESVR